MTGSLIDFAIWDINFSANAGHNPSALLSTFRIGIRHEVEVDCVTCIAPGEYFFFNIIRTSSSRSATFVNALTLFTLL